MRIDFTDEEFNLVCLVAAGYVSTSDPLVLAHIEATVCQRWGTKSAKWLHPSTEVSAPSMPPRGLVKILSEHVRVHVPGDDPDRWMFPGDGEDPLHQNSAGYLWRRARDKAGVDFRLHDLRHFYASGLIAVGCDVVTVQRALGHGLASLTLNTYSHLWPKAEDRTRRAAAQMLNEALGADRSLQQHSEHVSRV